MPTRNNQRGLYLCVCGKHSQTFGGYWQHAKTCDRMTAILSARASYSHAGRSFSFSGKIGPSRAVRPRKPAIAGDCSRFEARKVSRRVGAAENA
jgi:hypothetical protein